MTEPVAEPGRIEVVYSCEGSIWIDHYEFPQGEYVYTKIRKNGRGHVRLPDRIITYKKVYRIKVTGDRGSAK